MRSLEITPSEIFSNLSSPFEVGQSINPFCNGNRTPPPRLRGGGFKNTVFEDGGVENIALLECCILVFSVHFTLGQLLPICWQLFLLCSFGGQKNEKPRHTGRSSRLLLCSKVAFGQHFSVTSNLVTKVFSFAFWVLRNSLG